MELLELMKETGSDEAELVYFTEILKSDGMSQTTYNKFMNFFTNLNQDNKKRLDIVNKKYSGETNTKSKKEIYEEIFING